MGNCVFGGVVGGKEVIKVIRSNGGIMEFNAATTAESITDEFPGHAIFPSNHLFWKPIPHHQLLLPGNSYYLLPIIPDLINNATTTSTSDQLQRRRLGHIRPNTTTSCTSAAVAPYRMSFHHRTHKFLKKKTTYSSSTQHDQQAGGRPRGGVSTATTNNNNNNNNNNNYSIRNRGIWKVKLVISPQQLVHILSQQVPTQDLIDSVRTVAKCGIHYGSDADDSSFAFSHHWTLSTTSSTGQQLRTSSN